jgi:hypothetical protein
MILSRRAAGRARKICLCVFGWLWLKSGRVVEDRGPSVLSSKACSFGWSSLSVGEAEIVYFDCCKARKDMSELPLGENTISAPGQF